MKSKAVLQKDDTNKMKLFVNPDDKKVVENKSPEKVTDKKPKKSSKKSSALQAASMGRSALDAVNAHSSKDVRGSSGLANTGTIITYD